MNMCDFILGFAAGFWLVILSRTIAGKAKREKQHKDDVLAKKTETP